MGASRKKQSNQRIHNNQTMPILRPTLSGCYGDTLRLHNDPFCIQFYSITRNKKSISTSPEIYPTNYKLGGMMTEITSKLVGRKHSQGSDKLGRLSWITRNGKR